ncbi:hypothetical protein INT44_004402, partial [Umbelopsis vinacea]
QHKNNIGVKKRIRKNAYKARRGVKVPTVEMRKLVSKKKQQQFAKALKNEQKGLAAQGKIVIEEEMADAIDEETQQRTGDFQVPEEVLVAAASGPGTTLGGPQ